MTTIRTYDGWRLDLIATHHSVAHHVRQAADALANADSKRAILEMSKAQHRTTRGKHSAINAQAKAELDRHIADTQAIIRLIHEGETRRAMLRIITLYRRAQRARLTYREWTETT